MGRAVHGLIDGGGFSYWVTGKEWFAAVKARNEGKATPAQNALLDGGHWKQGHSVLVERAESPGKAR